MNLEISQEAERMRRSLQFKRAVDSRLNELVLRAQVVVDDTKVAERGSKMERSQFDNVLAVATETGSVEVVKNFIRYQIGRRDGMGWRHNRFGLLVVQDMDDWLKEQATAIAKATGVREGQAWMELVRQYLGYMRRWFVYRRWEAEGGQYV
jgi:hypothetical protein